MHQKKNERVKQLIVIKCMEPCGGSSRNVLRTNAIMCLGTMPTPAPVCSKAGTQATCAEVKGGEKEKPLISGVWTPADLGCHF